jgi:hypothetical protein
MKFGLKINTEFPIKKQKKPFMTTLGLMFFRGFVMKKSKSYSFYWESKFQWTSLLSLDPIGPVVLEKIKMWKVYSSPIQNVGNTTTWVKFFKGKIF